MANNVWDIKSNLQVQYFTGPGGYWQSIEADTFEVSIDRGILVERGVFARPDYGTAQIRLMKQSLSDLVTGPAYKPSLPLRIRYQPLPDTSPSTWNNVFYGYISNINMRFDKASNKLEIQINADDTTKILMNTRLDTFEIKSGVSTFKQIMIELETKINVVTGFSMTQDGSSGSSTSQDYDTYTDIISGELVNQVLDAELGWVYCGRASHTQYYLTRGDVNAKQATAWSNTATTISNVHSSSVDHICMDNIDLVFDTDNLINSCYVEHIDTKVNKTKKNTTSITNYGEWPADFSIDINTGSSPYVALADWAQAVVDAADPKRIQGVSCPALRRDGTTSKVIDFEISSPIQVEFVDPANSSNKIQQVALVTRMQHEISADHWEVTLGLWKGI